MMTYVDGEMRLVNISFFDLLKSIASSSRNGTKSTDFKLYDYCRIDVILASESLHSACAIFQRFYVHLLPSFPERKVW